jgi:hypothetical protein
VSEDVHIEVSMDVREQLRRLDPSQREDLVKGIYDLLPTGGRRIPLPGYPLYIETIGQFIFFYRDLNQKELSRVGKDAGYFVFEFQDIVKWTKRHFDQ